jgi:hypothetical protein
LYNYGKKFKLNILKRDKMKKILIALVFISISTYSMGRFTDNNNGIIKDNGTGLIWQKCSIGQTYSDNDCIGTAIRKTWKESLSSCSEQTLDGKNWRLPNINELKSIVEDQIYSSNTAIHEGFFPHTRMSRYWSSSTSTGDISESWYVDFHHGHTNDGSKTDTNYVRCVSGP